MNTNQLLIIFALMVLALSAPSQEFILHNKSSSEDFGPYILEDGAPILDGSYVIQTITNGYFKVRGEVGGIGYKYGPFIFTNNAVLKINDMSLQVVTGKAVDRLKEKQKEKQKDIQKQNELEAKKAQEEYCKKEALKKTPDVQKEVDEFKNITKYHFSDWVDLNDHYSYNIQVNVNNETKLMSPYISFENFWFGTKHPIWPHLHARSVILLIDGKRYDLEQASYENHIGKSLIENDSLYREFMTADMTMVALKAMNDGVSVRVRVGEDALTLSPENCIAVKKLYAQLIKDYPQVEKIDDSKAQK
jgi:hypothetical protein